MRGTECLFKLMSVLAWKCSYIFLHLNSPNLIENDQHLVFFFGYKVSTQQQFKTRLFCKTAKKLKFCAKVKCIALLTKCTIHQEVKGCFVKMCIWKITSRLYIILSHRKIEECLSCIILLYVEIHIPQMKITFRKCISISAIIKHCLK